MLVVVRTASLVLHFKGKITQLAIAAGSILAGTSSARRSPEAGQALKSQQLPFEDVPREQCCQEKGCQLNCPHIEDPEDSSFLVIL